MYMYSLGVEKDINRAAPLILAAGKAGFAKAQYNLGKMFRDGKGVQKDLQTAAQWFLAAAKQGHVRAQNHIGMRYARGKGITADPVQAMMWLTLSAKSGNPAAVENRAALARKLTAAQIADAERLAAAWKPMPAK